MPTAEEALGGALDQIAAAFGKEELLTPKQREMRLALNAKMRCLQCSKRLSRKTARLINGRALCSSCALPETKAGRYVNPVSASS